jgi:tetratricopeptide (TPR) repeat protein
MASTARNETMPSEPRPELEKELAEIRREVIESRNLVIKTDNLLKNLHAEVKAVGKRQEDSERRQWISSAVAYLLFAGLCLGGGILLVMAKGGAAKEERERLEKQVAELSQQADKQKTDTNGALLASRQAADVYKLMTTLPGDERLKGVDSLAKLDQSRLSALEKQALADRAALLRREIGQGALERGRAASRRNDAQTVITELGRFMALGPSAEEGNEASFLLGAAYVQVHKYDQAAAALGRFINADKKARTRDYAMLLLTQSYELSGQLDKAAATAREALGTYPNSEYVPQLKMRLTAAKHLMEGGTDAPAGVNGPPAPKPPSGGAPPGQSPEAARPPLKPAASPLPAQ